MKKNRCIHKHCYWNSAEKKNEGLNQLKNDSYRTNRTMYGFWKIGKVWVWTFTFTFPQMDKNFTLKSCCLSQKVQLNITLLALFSIEVSSGKKGSQLGMQWGGFPRGLNCIYILLLLKYTCYNKRHETKMAKCKDMTNLGSNGKKRSIKSFSLKTTEASEKNDRFT